jgi:hypothetical protein
VYRTQKPEPNRLIRVKGTGTWGTFECIGKWVPYKSPPNKPGSGRFMIQLLDGSYAVGRDAWADRESWEYIDG